MSQKRTLARARAFFSDSVISEMAASFSKTAGYRAEPINQVEVKQGHRRNVKGKNGDILGKNRVKTGHFHVPKFGYSTSSTNGWDL